jgi:hypothetical protein
VVVGTGRSDDELARDVVQFLVVRGSPFDPSAYADRPTSSSHRSVCAAPYRELRLQDIDQPLRRAKVAVERLDRCTDCIADRIADKRP